MQTRVIVRLLGADDALLGWTEVSALARGDGQLWATEAVTVLPDVHGTAEAVSVHWVDVNVELRSVIPAIFVDRNVTVFPPGPIFRVGPQAGGLPPVTVKTPIRIGVPVGAFGAVGT